MRSHATRGKIEYLKQGLFIKKRGNNLAGLPKLYREL
jgi:hypothetical protein